MSNRKAGAYGTSTGGDTTHRKTWDRAEYAAKAAATESKQKDESKARYEAKLAGRKYIPRGSTPPDAAATSARAARLNFGDQIGRTTLVAAGAAVGKRGRGAGFYCEACDLTFKDNLQFVEHENSKQHLVAIGESGEVRRAGAGEVRERLGWLKRRLVEERRDEVVDLGERLERAREVEEAERAEKRRKRNERRRKTKDGLGVKREDDGWDGVIR
ncbi:hypothetical protein K402DRAFT_451954 [Aulographum hederae CBS 113979]|uniref:C2H2-type domain-containing protein n=1 Tax=Aulographum hederae CBS 113979 TaxID=1176131 RepID=A0A6G1H9P4_9PEZI|nr:hypothetical protein K402DRAFT_451954 [Aulographum hederae CBS 113979]